MNSLEKGKFIKKSGDVVRNYARS